MPTRAIPYVKVLVHLACLAPVVFLVWWYKSGALAANADPVNYITHFTGNWALWILLACLAVTPLRRVHARLSNLIRFRRLIGLYAFFYATLHLATYVFLYSGYDIMAALAGVRSGHPGVLATEWKAVWPSMVDDALKRRFIQLGLFAWAILLALALTSPVFMLRKMGGKNWQRLHRLVYVAAIAGCIHYWWIVKRGVMLPLPDTLVLAVLLLARVVWSVWKRRRQAVARPVSAAG
jgi:sulfoxide reductase heme-binding subunit YedZ